jgi:hypothetical protein
MTQKFSVTGQRGEDDLGQRSCGAAATSQTRNVPPYQSYRSYRFCTPGGNNDVQICLTDWANESKVQSDYPFATI